ncbi:MAG: hypothetical protein ACLFUO_00715 [Candidatus Woesearchaeota archaeon]
MIKISELTKNEKELIVSILNKHLEEIRENENLLNQNLEQFAAEVKYENFVEKIINKLS